MTEPSKIAEALAAFHKELPEVTKGSTNSHFGSRYADLADIVKVVLPALAAQGLAWIATPTFTENGFVLAYELRHTSGESIRGEWPLPDPEKANSQQLGSATTYAKRFALSAVTGIAPDEDDDGNAASSGPSASTRRRPSPQARAEQTNDTITRAVAAISAAHDASELDKLEDLAKSKGIDGVTQVAAAITAKREELGASLVDHWATAEVPS